MHTILQKNFYRILFAIQLIAFFDVVLFALLYLSPAELTTFFVYFTIFVFFAGSLLYMRNLYFVRTYFKRLKKRYHTVEEVSQLADIKGRVLPRIAILVPARDEGRVIENTIRRLTELDYPKDAYKIYVIVDERERLEGTNGIRFTRDVARETIIELQDKYPKGLVNCVEVPEWYSGKLGDFSQSYAHSTKGRALNYCLEYMRYMGEDEEVEMMGVLDADGRLDRDALKEVAYTRLMKESKILQGIVFGTSNIGQLNIVGRGAMLEGAIHHLTFMAHRILSKRRKLLFLAGTNYFFERELLYQVGGWDGGSLVEDAELGLRTYLLTGQSADWLSCPEIEQSPSNFSTYYKQRERWARGHFQLIPYVFESDLPLHYRIWLIAKIYVNAYSSIWHLGVPVIGWILMLTGAYVIAPHSLQYLMVYLLFISIAIFDFYGFMFRMLRPYMEPYQKQPAGRWATVVTSVALFYYTPVHFVIQALPRFAAPFKYYRAPEKPQLWYKTERTFEESERAIPAPASVPVSV